MSTFSCLKNNIHFELKFGKLGINKTILLCLSVYFPDLHLLHQLVRVVQQRVDQSSHGIHPADYSADVGQKVAKRSGPLCILDHERREFVLEERARHP